MIKVDYHCHVLPELDDGAKNAAIADEMLDEMRKQGICEIALTPHFRPHREKSVEAFLAKREASFQKLAHRQKEFKFYPGAEAAMERGVSEIPQVEKLAIEGTRLLLLELPFEGYGSWVLEELYNLECDTGLKPVLAHIHRYTDVCSRTEMEELLNLDVIFQINTEALTTFFGRRFVQKLLKREKEVVFGSDAHNMTSRVPDYSPLCKHLKKDVLIRSDEVIKKYQNKDAK